ncbi:MAG TPA: hypothetical protein VHC39_15120 [Rhizomicrobium sp.]|nr:hypothetical protein [Rhizomicrobium sp.]
MGLLIRAVNFCVLSAAGFVLLSPVLAHDTPLDRQLRLLLPQTQAETVLPQYRRTYDDQLAWVFGNLKAQIHGELCRRNDLEILHPASCGRDSNS